MNHSSTFAAALLALVFVAGVHAQTKKPKPAPGKNTAPPGYPTRKPKVDPSAKPDKPKRLTPRKSGKKGRQKNGQR